MQPQMRQLLYATSNPGKVMEMRSIVEGLGLSLVTPDEIGVVCDVPENGATLRENAAQKAHAYLDALADQSYVVLADDSGIEIDALNGEPGIHVRRWTGQARMTDEAIIAYCLERMAGVPSAARGAQFRTVFALGVPGGDLEFVDGTLRGVILEEAASLRIDGFPFESIFFVPEWGLLLGEVHALPPECKANFVTHRARALQNVLPRLRAMLGRT